MFVKLFLLIFWGDIDNLEFLKVFSLNICIVDFLVMEIYV